jgi:carbamate kinase
MLKNVLNKHQIKKEVVTLVTQVVIDKDDEAFKNPTKRVGKTCTVEEAERLQKEKGWIFKEEAKVKDGWRRVVPSPTPLSIANEKVIKSLVNEGTIVIAVGGGGIPVYIDEQNDVRTAEAVIDKDLASALLAIKIKADEFYVLTDVSYVYLNFNQPNQEIAEFLNYADTKKHLEEGMFGEGSMGPKIKAALKFIEKGGSKSIITEATKLEDKKYGTKITMEYE